MALTSGTKLGPYEIQSPLGAGGMGEVYRATDTKLGRDIALKVLPADMAHDPERLARFRREAKALAQLDHPNIVTIHSVEECDGVHFLTMQLVEGQPLDRLIPASGLPLEQIVEIASALGDALAAAHEKGIVHRDLKPANVMVSNDGRVKVLDFGLAKDIRAANLSDATMTSDSRTQIGVVMGTPAYMSPEQTSGRPLDHRTDIFSLGVVLHEMATGRRPFDGNSSAELVSAILRDTAPSVTDVRPDLPSDLARVIRRCLEKDPRHRMQTARDVSNEFRDLARQTSQKVTPAKASAARTVAAADSSSTRADEGFWVAVLPLRGTSGDAVLEALAEGLTEDVTTGLSRFPYLQVIAHNSTVACKGRAADIRTVGRELGARYLIEGSIRRRGRALRVSAQLMDAANGTQLWAESYDREISDREGNDTGTFQIQDDLTDRIVTSVADGYGVLVRSMAAPTRARKVEELSASELVLRHYAFMQQVNLQEHAVLRAGLERALEREPNHAAAWACLSNLYQLEYFDRFNPREKPMERAREAAWRAVKIDPACQMGWKELASVHFFSRDFTAFRETAERAMSLNPRDSSTLAMMAIMIAFSGDWERGMALAQRAIDLNRHHPGWYHNVSFHHHYRKRDYEAALQAAKKINMPEFHWMHLATAASCGMLGRHEEARTAIESLQKYNPTFLDLENVRVDVGMWDPDKDEVEHFLQGLQKAGLKYGSADNAAADSIATHSKQTDSKQTTTEPKLKSDPTPAVSSLSIASATTSGASCVDEGFWVAVLPFKYSGSNVEFTALAEGLSEDIVTGLSRFSYLKVIARSSTSHYANQSVDVRSAGKELGARYVMEGSLRQAGTRVRLAVQLVDTTSGAHLWAENYERDFQTGGIFALQDDLVPRIVSTVADQYGILPRSMSEILRTKKDEDLTAHEAVLRTFSYFTRITPEEHAAVGKILERAVREAPDHADSWAMLSMIYRGEFAQGFNAGPNPLDRALAAAQRAVDLAPTNALSHYALATVYFFRKEMTPFRVEEERALALNPLDASVRAYLGLLIAAAGEWDRGCQMVESAMQLNPNCPGYFYFARCCNGYRQGRYAEVLEDAARVNMPGYFHTHAMRAAALGQLGRREEARKAVQNLLALRPDFAAAARQEYAKWYDSELVEQMIEGLRKAGLQIAPKEEAPLPALDMVRSQAKDSSGAVRADEGFWVAVLPFKYAGVNADLKALADGLTDDIVTGLSRFSYLRVIARGSTTKYLSESGDIRTIGKELGARYVMEGNLRQAGTKLRLAVQLVDTVSGTHLWAETYERDFSPEAVFALQDDLVPRIVSTVADSYGVLPYSMSDLIRSKPLDQLSPYEALLRAIGCGYRLSPEEYAVARTCLERAVDQAPGYADGWAMLAMLYADEYGLEFNAQPDPLGRALQAARRATDAAPASSFAQSALAKTLFFRKEFQAFRSAAEQAISFNPMDGSKLAQLGGLLAYSGDWERGCALVERAIQLNPRHPAWYWFPLAWNAYRKGDYRGSVNIALKINLPGFFPTYEVLAAAYGQLGERDAANEALSEMLKLAPIFGKVARALKSKWFDPEMVDHVLEGLRKAGLEIADDPAKPGTSPLAANSGATRADEGFWVAVLPFKYGGANSDLTALAEGLSEDIVTGLSRFSYLRVIARSSTTKYSSESGDVRAIGKELGARYVMEGSLRQAGSRLRLAVRLVDATTGAHLWAETYDRAFVAEEIFELQDDLVPRIVSTVADTHGVLPYSMSQTLRNKNPDDLSPYEALLRGFAYFKHVNAADHAGARAALEKAVQQAPGNADCWAMLAMLYREENNHGFNVRPDPVGRALAAARRAVDAAPSNHLAHHALASVLFFRRETQAFRSAAQRAIELNPMDGFTIGYMGFLISFSGDWDRGCALMEKARNLNPNHPGWYWFPPFFNAYRKGDYRAALEFALKVNMPGFWRNELALAATYGKLGELELARNAARELLAVRPNFAAAAREECDKWWEPELVEQLIDGLRKAGLEIAEKQ
jgi:TolB-like protein/Tfp pilus assembly protein PilF